MTPCAERLLWTMALMAFLPAVFSGDVRTAGMVITVAAVAWYGLICPFAEAVRGFNLKSKGSVN
jgi:hypothetical protein